MRIAVFGLGTSAPSQPRASPPWTRRLWRRRRRGQGRLHPAGRSPVVEPGIDDLVAKAVGEGDLAPRRIARCAERADVSLLCVGTPSILDTAAPT